MFLSATTYVTPSVVSLRAKPKYISNMHTETITDELIGSQPKVAKKICGLKIIKNLFYFYHKFLGTRNLRVNNLNVNFYLTIEDKKIGDVRIEDVSEVSIKSPGNQIVQEQHNYGGLRHG